MTFSNRVITVTQDKIMPKVFDNILSDNFATFRFISNGKKWAGETMKFPVKLAKNEQGGSFSGLDVHNTGTVNVRQFLQYDLRGYEIPVAIPGLEKVVNRGDAQVINLVRAELESTQMDALDQIGDIIYDDGTGNDGKDFYGFGYLNDDGTTSTTVGGLSKSTYPSLAGDRDSFGGLMTLTKLGTFLSGMSGGSAKRQKPSILTSDETVWDLYESLLTPTVKANYDANGYPMVTRASRGAIPEAQMKGNQGFSAVMFRGIPWVADEKHIATTILGHNENYTGWYGIQDPDMTSVSFGDTHDGVYSEAPTDNTGLQFSGFMKPTNQYGEVGHIYLLGNMCTSQPRRQGRRDDVDTV
jgi:hypothetical protein